MSDFLAWLSPSPIPHPLRRRWTWPGDNHVGIRRRSFMPIGIDADDRSLVVVLGWNRGTRNDPRSVGESHLATKIGERLKSAGIDGLDQFLGPIAGVHLDYRRRQLQIWRDRFGRIPIQLIELKEGWAVTTCPETARSLTTEEPRRDHLLGFLADDQGTDDLDALEGIRRLRPAEVISFDRNFEIADRQFWWKPQPQSFDSDNNEADRQMTERLQQLGAHFGQRPHILALSAGLDSSTLAAVATARHPGSEAVTFVDPVSPRDEGPEAAQLAEHLHLRWTPFAINRHGPLTRPADHRFPEAWGPAGHPDLAWKLPCHRWLSLRRPGLPLVYGNGADDLLWVPRPMWLRDRWRHADFSTLLKASKHLSAMELVRPGLGFAIDGFRLRSWRHLFPSPTPQLPRWQACDQWIGDRLPDDTPPLWPAGQRLFHYRLWRLQTWRWERAMRSLALESRLTERPIFTPFLDAQFWELGLSLSPGDLVEGGRQKAILRRAVGDLLPAGCRRRPKVGGFDPVVERGLVQMASHRVYALFARPRLAEAIDFDASSFLQAFEAYRRAPGCEQRETYRGSWAIWKTVAAELWLRLAGQAQFHRH